MKHQITVSDIVLTSTQRDKSVLTPSEQTPELCEAGSSQVTRIITQLHKLLANQQEPEIVRAGIALMFQEGLRVSEMLNISGIDVKPGLKIVIKGLKYSHNRLVQPISFRTTWERFQGVNLKIGDDWDRYWLYRLFRRYNIQLSHVTGQNLSVTHSLRYIYIKQLAAESVDIELIQKAIGHKSIKSTQHYERKK